MALKQTRFQRVCLCGRGFAPDPTGGNDFSRDARRENSPLRDEIIHPPRLLHHMKQNYKGAVLNRGAAPFWGGHAGAFSGCPVSLVPASWEPASPLPGGCSRPQNRLAGAVWRCRGLSASVATLRTRPGRCVEVLASQTWPLRDRPALRRSHHPLDKGRGQGMPARWSCGSPGQSVCQANQTRPQVGTVGPGLHCPEQIPEVVDHSRYCGGRQQ